MKHTKPIDYNDLSRTVNPGCEIIARPRHGASPTARLGLVGAVVLVWTAVAIASYGQLPTRTTMSGYGIDEVTQQAGLIER